MKRTVLIIMLGILVATSLFLGGCSAISARSPGWKEKYDPPYQGLKHTIHSTIIEPDPLGSVMIFDLPFTFVVDTCLLPWDLVTIVLNSF